MGALGYGRYSVYLLYYYKSTNTDTGGAASCVQVALWGNVAFGLVQAGWHLANFLRYSVYLLY